jgi:phospholipid/cholesterol/gamma-HCH transport system permease protein
MIAGTLGAIGRPALQALAAIGRLGLFAGTVILGHILRPPFYLREFGVALLQIGWFSCRWSA